MAEGATSTPPAYSTPTKRAAFANAEAGPSRRPQGASPAYSSRRHSLYGIEDRIVIDPGSRTWKVGYSGETDPRAVFWAQDESDRQKGRSEAWDLDLERLEGCRGDTHEAGRLVGVRIVKKMRETFSKHLLTDAKSRKVIVLESTYLPAYVKEHIAHTLFDNLKVPSVSFTSSALLSLVACGRITGLVVDCGWLETTVTPVYYSRPLYNLSRSTPLAGRALHRRLKTLLKHHGVYYPPLSSLNSLARTATTPPDETLTDELIERIITEACFVGGVIVSPQDDLAVRFDLPEGASAERQARMVQVLKDKYSPHSSATDLPFPTRLAGKGQKGMGPGRLVVPGWIRQRAVEVLFEGDPEGEEGSLPDTILQCILKLPVDIRPTLASTILVTGGTPSLPGFIPRLRISLKSLLLPPPSSPASDSFQPTGPLHSPEYRRGETAQWRIRGKEPYASIYGLLEKIAILNDPAPLDGGDGGGSETSAGSAPRWVPSLLGWVGGSLAGSLKSGGPEISREEYDTLLAESQTRSEGYQAELEAMEVEVAALVGIDVEELRPGMALDGGGSGRKRGWREGVGIRDWTRVGVV